MSRTTGSEAEWDYRFRTRVSELRKAKGLTQTDLAKALQDFPGVKLGHQQTIARIEAGDRPVRLGEAPYIARVLGTTVQAMVSAEGSLDDVDLSLGMYYDELEGLRYELSNAEVAFRDLDAAAKALDRQSRNQEVSLGEALAGGSVLAADVARALARFTSVEDAFMSLQEAMRLALSAKDEVELRMTEDGEPTIGAADLAALQELSLEADGKTAGDGEHSEAS